MPDGRTKRELVQNLDITSTKQREQLGFTETRTDGLSGNKVVDAVRIDRKPGSQAAVVKAGRVETDGEGRRQTNGVVLEHDEEGVATTRVVHAGANRERSVDVGNRPDHKPGFGQRFKDLVLGHKAHGPGSLDDSLGHRP